MRKLIHILAIIAIISSALMAQNDVNITILVNQPYSPYLADYIALDNQAIIQVQNLTNREIPIKLIGRITGDNGYEVGTRPDYTVFNPTVLQPFETKTLVAGGSDFDFFNTNNLFTNVPQDIGENALRTGVLPEGNYEICLRAADPDTNAPLSMEFCSPINISYLDAPTPISPMCGQATLQRRPNFVWTSPVGNIGGASFRYDLYVLKYTPDFEDPDAMLQFAVDYNAGNVQIVRDIFSTSYSWDISDPELFNGHYAWMVVARDDNGQVFFQNNGRSEVCTFNIQELTIIPPNVLIQDTLADDEIDLPDNVQLSYISGGSCDIQGCPRDTSLNVTPISVGDLAVGSDIQVGYFEMTIAEISQTTDYDISGIGTIDMPVVGSSLVRVRVAFNNMQINSDQELIGGQVSGEVQGIDPSIIPNYTTPSTPGSPANLGTNLSNYFNNVGSNLLAAGSNFLTSTGFSFPIGIEFGSNIIAITDINLTKQSAEVAMAVVFAISETTDALSDLALSGQGICMDSTSFCGNVKLQLDNDFEMNMQGGGKMTFLAPDNPVNGTFVQVNNDSIQNFSFRIDYEFPETVINQPGGANRAVAHITAAGTEWDDWIGDITIDSFIIADFEDMVFKNASGVIDHSDLKNPVGFPLQKFNQPGEPDIIAKFNDFQDVLWTGFWLKSLNIDLPGIFSNTDQNIDIVVANMIIDDDGVSAEILAQEIFDMGDETVDTQIGVDFRFSMDEIGISIINNSFTSGFFNGEMRLPITNSTEQQSYLDYSSTLSYSNANTQNNPDPNQPQQQGSTFQYEFVVQANNVYVPLFIGEMNFDTTTHIRLLANNATTKVDGILNGDISITDPFGDEDVNIGIPLMQFQNISFDSDDPDFMTGGTFGLASPQKFLGRTATNGEVDADVGGFAMTLDNIHLDTRTNTDGNFGIGLGFDVGINLTDLNLGTVSTTGGFTLWGEFDNGEPEYDEIEFNSLHIWGEVSVLKFDGMFKIYSNDSEYGDGFYGAVAIEVQDMFAVSTTMQFGSTSNLRYWYFDGEMEFATGITMFPGIDLYGFGGGAYYNMVQKEGNRAAIQYDSIVPDLTTIQVGQSNSHMSYTPSAQSGAFGFKAKVFFGMTGEKTIYNGDVTFEMAFDSDNGLNRIELQGDVNFISNDQFSDPIVMVQCTAKYEPPLQKFSLDAHFDVDATIITGAGDLSILIDGIAELWYIKVGTPTVPITIKLLDAVTAEAYFQIGNEIDDIPGIPQKILDIINKSSGNSDNRVIGEEVNKTKHAGKRNAGNVSSMSQPNSFGIIAGAYAYVDEEGEFLIFYGRIYAGIGFDVSLKQTQLDCDGNINPNDPVGLNGWFAEGQLYAGVEIELGIHIDFGFIDERISLVSAGVGAYLQMAGPNPFWARGEVGGYFSVLDGLIEGNIRYGFQVGERCAFSKDGLEGLKIISSISPGNPDPNNPEAMQVISEPMSTLVQPQFATLFNLQNEIIPVPIYDEDGTEVERVRLFKLKRDNFSISLQKEDQELVGMNEHVYLDQHGMALVPGRSLTRETDYHLRIEVTLNECSSLMVRHDNGRNARCLFEDDVFWPKAKTSENGPVWKEKHHVRFTTDAGLTRIPSVLDQWPYANHRYFSYKDNGRTPFVRTPSVIDINSYAIDISVEEAANFDLKYSVGYTPMPEGPMIKVPAQAMGYGERIEDEFPAVLDPSKVYLKEHFVEWVPKTPQGAQLLSVIENKALAQDTSNTTQKYADYSAILKDRKVGATSLSIANSNQVYDYYFRTSKYPSLEAKINDMEIGGTTIVCGLTKLTGDSIEDNRLVLPTSTNLLPFRSVHVHRDDQQDLDHLKAHLKQELENIYRAEGNLPAGPNRTAFNPDDYRVIYAMESDVYLIGDEHFDQIEVDRGLVDFRNDDRSDLWDEFIAEYRDKVISPFIAGFDAIGSRSERNIGGSSVDVTNLVGPSALSTIYHITPENIKPALDVENDGYVDFSSPKDNGYDPNDPSSHSSGNNAYQLDVGSLIGSSNTSHKYLINHVVKIKALPAGTTHGGGGLSGVITIQNTILDGIIKGSVDPNPIGQNWSQVGVAYDVLQDGFTKLLTPTGAPPNISGGAAGGQMIGIN